MDNFFVVRRVPQYVQKVEIKECKYLDEHKFKATIENATTVDELIQLFKVLHEDDDPELDHIMADKILAKALRMLGQDELADEYEKIDTWSS